MKYMNVHAGGQLGETSAGRQEQPFKAHAMAFTDAGTPPPFATVSAMRRARPATGLRALPKNSPSMWEHVDQQ
jgi:hypothetical protein